MSFVSWEVRWWTEGQDTFASGHKADIDTLTEAWTLYEEHKKDEKTIRVQLLVAYKDRPGGQPTSRMVDLEYIKPGSIAEKVKPHIDYFKSL